MSARPRVFVDSNILFSASLLNHSRFEAFWSLPDTDILTSQYSIAEVSRNLKTADQRARLWRLIYRSHLVPDGTEILLDSSVSLPDKDLPILKSAVEGCADILVTGDIRHFGRYVGTTLQGVLIQTPPEFKRRYPAHFATETFTQ